MAVEDRPHGVGDRLVHVVAVDEHGVEGGDGAQLRRAGALEQLGRADMADPLKLTNATRLGRYATWVLLAAITLDNTLSAVLLDVRILTGEVSNKAAVLLGSGGAFSSPTSFFGIWYWELDRGGPFARRAATSPTGLHVPPDGPRHRQARQTGMAADVVDYLYVSLTNAMAFSPTDTMPLARWAKGMMAVQSLVAVTTIALNHRTDTSRADRISHRVRQGAGQPLATTDPR